jgi:hypothetical protein
MPFRKNLHRILGLFFAMVLLGAFSLTAFAASSSPAGPQVRQRAFPRKTCAASGTGERAHLLKRFCPARSRANLRRSFAMLLAVLLATLFRSGGAQAACSSPAGAAGDTMYNSAYHVPQYCDGTNWHVMGPQGAGGSGCGDVASGLVGYWKFDETSGTTAADSSGNGNTGTLTNGPAWTTGGMNNGALTFNGTSQYVSVPDASNLRGNNYTITAWVYFNSLVSATYDIVVKGYANSGDKSYEMFEDSSGQLGFWSNGTGVFSAGGNMNAGEWYFIAATRSGSTATIYMDGVQMNQSTSFSATTSYDTTPVVIGAFSQNNGTIGNYLTGIVDDARIYNRALSAAEVTQAYYAGPTGSEGSILYNSYYHVPQFCDGTRWIAMGPQGAGGTNYAPTSGLVGWWKLDESSGPSAADATGNGNTGTWTNSPTYTASGKINGALTFANATDTYVDVANPSNFAFERTNAFTLAAWIYRTSTATEGNILAKVLSSAGWTGYSFWMDFNGASFFCTSNCVKVTLVNDVGTSNTLYVSADNTPAATGAWHHVAATYDGSSTAAGVKIYVDGVAQATVVIIDNLTASILAATDLKIGVDVTGQTDAFTGRIDDARVYNRALSAAEVTALYNYTGGSTCSPEGAMFYNSDYNVMQYCNSTSWVSIGK